MKRNKITAVILSIVMSMSLMMPSVEVLADEASAPSETQKIESTETKEPETTERSTPQSTEKKESKVTETHEPKETAKQELEETQKKESVSEPTETQNSETTMGSECEPSQTRNIEDSKGKDTETSETQPSQSSETSAVEPTGTQETVTTARPDTPIVAKRNAKNITVSEIQTKLNTKMKQTGYVPGGKPPSSYVNGSTCYGFVDSLCRYLFGHGLPSIAGSKYALVSSSNLSQVGNTLTYSAGNTSSSQLKNLFLSCQPGDVVQMNYFSDKAASGSADYHTLMVYSVSESGVVFYHAGSSTVWYGGLWSTTGKVFTWSSFSSWFGEAGDGISVYRSKQSNGTPLPVTTWINASCGSSTTTGTNVTLTWGASNAASYWLHIYKDGSDYYNAGQEGRTSWSHTFTSAGTYTCYITPYGKWDYISSSEGTNASVTITVTSRPASAAPTISNLRIAYSGYRYNASYPSYSGYYEYEADIIDPGKDVNRYWEYKDFDPKTGSCSGYGEMSVSGNKIIGTATGQKDGHTTKYSISAITSSATYNLGDHYLTYKLPTYTAKASYQNHDYYLFDQGYTWNDANDFATKYMGGNLVSINSSAEQNVINSLIEKGTIKRYYTGGRANSSRNWTWTDGSSFSYSNWFAGQPDNSGGTQDALVAYSTGWDDDNAGLKNTYGFIVEVVRPTYYITGVAVNGSVSFSKTAACEGEEITVYATPLNGYELYLVKVNENTITGDKFTMPAGNVTVEVRFKRIDAPGLGFTTTINGYTYKVTNAASDGTGTVTLVNVEKATASVSIPATVEIYGYTYKVDRIGPKAFYKNTTIKTLSIGANIKIIDSYAFYGCSNMTSVSGGKSLVTIGSYAFASCSKLKSFNITSAALGKIGPYTFKKDKKLKTIKIKRTVKLTKAGVKKSLKGSSVKTVKVKKSKVKKYKKIFKKKNSGRSVKVKK